MERPGIHKKKKSTKQAEKAKKKPVKVVYISNPMKVKASVAEFRSVVQELTGQDSSAAADLSEYGTAETAASDPPPPVGFPAEPPQMDPGGGADLQGDAYGRMANPIGNLGLDECLYGRGMLDGFSAIAPLL